MGTFLGRGLKSNTAPERQYVNNDAAESGQARSNAGLFDPSIKDVVKGLTSKDTVVDAYKAIARVSGQDWKTDDPRVGVLSMLAWYGRNYYPRRYLELGIMQADGYGVIASTCPSTEICAIEHLKGPNSVYLMANVLKKTREEGLRTHLHLLTADHLQSLKRLERIAATFPDFDLAYIRIETIADSIP